MFVTFGRCDCILFRSAFLIVSNKTFWKLKRVAEIARLHDAAFVLNISNLPQLFMVSYSIWMATNKPNERWKGRSYEQSAAVDSFDFIEPEGNYREELSKSNEERIRG